MTKPELLAPAGDKDRLETALLYGADAVYFGPSNEGDAAGLSLRAATAGFSPEQTAEAAELAHAHGARAYYCLNALPREQQMDAVRRTIEQVRDAAIDAFIIADPGVLRLAQRLAPHVEIHLSTQANTANAESARFWHDQGVTRIVLARELDATAIRAVREACPEVEIEVFAHGAQCMAVSGRCALSAHLSNRPANLGACTHPCRYDYRRVAFEERTRPGEVTWEVECDREYQRFFSADDLCLVRFMKWFASVGVSAIKIEGRTKTAGYVAQVVHAYRAALDALSVPGAFDVHDYLEELLTAATRPLSTGFFLPNGKRTVLQPPAPEERKPVVGKIVGRAGSLGWRVAVRGPWFEDDPVLVMKPCGRYAMLAPDKYTLLSDAGERCDRVHPGTETILACDDASLAPGMYLRR